MLIDLLVFRLVQLGGIPVGEVAAVKELAPEVVRVVGLGHPEGEAGGIFEAILVHTLHVEGGTGVAYFEDFSLELARNSSAVAQRRLSK